MKASKIQASLFGVNGREISIYYANRFKGKSLLKREQEIQKRQFKGTRTKLCKIKYLNL